MNERHYIDARLCGIKFGFKTRHVNFWMYVLAPLVCLRRDYTSQQLAETTHMVGGMTVTERYRRLQWTKT